MQFAIHQDDRTRLTHVYEPNIGWVQHSPERFEEWAKNVEFMRQYPLAFCQAVGIEVPDP